jgi:hypothetical protein
MGLRTDQGHFTSENIEELRKLIEAGFPQQPAEFEDAWVVPQG